MVNKCKRFTLVELLVVIAGLGIVATCKHVEANVPRLLDVDYRQLISQADLIYERPAAAPVQGQPIGNGRMGTLVWTSPGAVHMQINRVDVFAVNKNHIGKREGPPDYCGGVAQIQVDVSGEPFQGGEKFQQHLSLYNAEEVIRGDGVTTRCFVSSASDVLVVEVDDQRVQPQPVRLTVSMWRAPVVKAGEHIARYEFGETDDKVSVVQEFTERDYYCSSAVAAVIVGGDTRIEAPGDRTRTIVAPAKRGKTMLLISSSASFSNADDVGATAVGLVKTASARSYRALQIEHEEWWKEFWSRTFVYLQSDDTVATFMQRIRSLHLYYMASTSRGVLPAKWNASLFSVNGDKRYWGAQFWIWTTAISHHPLYASDASDLADPYFNMYVNQLPDARKAAKQRWGVKKGAYFMEAGPFDGPVVLPPAIGQEYQDVYLGRKTVKDFSPAALALGQYECVLTQFADGHSFRGIAGRYSFVSHYVACGSDLAVQAWWRYRYTGDKAFLRTHAYPLLRDTLELYRCLARKEDDGKYHLYGLNQQEGFWGINDGIVDLGAIRGTAPLAIRASEILGVDADMRPKWREFLENLTPYPMGSDPGSQALGCGIMADDVWSVGHLGEVKRGGRPGATLAWPIFTFEDWTLETRDAETDRIVRKIGELNASRVNIANGAGHPGDHATLVMGSRIGRGDDLPVMTASYYWGSKPLPNGLSAFEGKTAHSIEILGCIATTVQEGLIQSVSPRPGQGEIISVFPAWPKKWDASFRLLARGGFLVTSAMKNGQVEFVEVESRFGEPCRLRNPWGKPCIVNELDGPSQVLEGELLRFDTVAGKRYRVFPQAAPPPAAQSVQVQPTGKPWSYAITLSGGKSVAGTVGQ